MRARWLLLIAILLASAIILPITYIHLAGNAGGASEEFFFGVSYGGNLTSHAKSLIDRVKDYTNFFLINNWDISLNEAALNEISQYAIDAGMSIMVYFDFIPYNTYPWLQNWLTTAKDRWGDKFLGVYLYDEPGGKQIDMGQWRSGDSVKDLFNNVTDYTDAANRFTTAISSGPSWQFAKNNNIRLFTSDYALYWFDYLAGYDAVFVELGWDHNTTQHIGLCRGAANMQSKDWGAIIVWKDRAKPGIGSGEEILQDMVAAYRAGAKYVVVFNFPYNQPYGILKEEHFDAMETFWEMTHSPQSALEKEEAEAAFVLPKDYGWGMRSPEDKIWGVWPADGKAPLIWNKMNKLIKKYELKLDIIYDEPQCNYSVKYPLVYCWNNTIIENL